MTVVYSDVYQKWIAFDAAMGTYYTDEEKVPLNVKEIRRILLEGKPLLTPYLPPEHLPKSALVSLQKYDSLYRLSNQLFQYGGSRNATAYYIS